MQEWVHRMKPEQKRVQVLTEEMASAIDRFFFNHYCVSFRSGAFARANSSMYVYLTAPFNYANISSPKTNDEYVRYGH